MKQLKLKQEYLGMSVTIHHPKLGALSFISGTDESHYPYYNQNGFDFLFEKPVIPAKTKIAGKKYKGIILDNNNPAGE